MDGSQSFEIWNSGEDQTYTNTYIRKFDTALSNIGVPLDEIYSKTIF